LWPRLADQLLGFKELQFCATDRYHGNLERSQDPRRRAASYQAKIDLSCAMQ
jgi:hypothetical protein